MTVFRDPLVTMMDDIGDFLVRGVRTDPPRPEKK